MFFGSHVSIRSGYLHAAETAYKLGATAFQYFPKNPRSLKIKKWQEVDAQNCASFCQKHQIKSVAHSPYPSKLIPESKEMETYVMESLYNDLQIAESCGSIGVVVHFGTTKKNDILEGYRKMIEMLDCILEKWDGEAKLLIENNAGTGTDMGITIEEMIQIRSLVDKKEKIGFCLDTCHAFASGLWDGDNWKTLKDKNLSYFHHLDVIHFNNSKYPYRSRKDRHANLMSGHLNETQMQQILNDSDLEQIPFILETPKDNSMSHQDEITLLKEWRTHYRT
ncbi:deoxyribonuclease IV [Bacillus solitudinis]|uniref:deoxyribonuclease IV n=1 Tax=Bacillus solitudinis TaxID=2014074 RepID=UPI000C236B36|nr:deoxyribonuclease IV [Bacillus solitudinis]